LSFIGSGIHLFLLVKGKNYLNFDRNFGFSFFNFYETILTAKAAKGLRKDREDI